MFQTDQVTAVSSLPTPATPATPGFFTGGNPGSGLPATILDADFLNMIQQELINVVEAGGETPSKTTYNQVLLAIKALMIAQGNTPGRLLRTSVYSNSGGTLFVSVNGATPVAAGTNVFTPLATTTAVDVEVVGAGGGSGGCAATAASQYAASAGAQGGAYARGYFTSAFNGITITAGAAGAAAAAGAAGGNGGSSSAGALLTASGGLGTAAAAAVAFTSPLFSGPNSAQSGATGTAYVNIPTSGGGFSIGVSGGLMVGAGGSTPLGTGGVQLASGSRSGSGFGGGASGSGVGASSAAQPGAIGATGAVIVREYA